MIGEAASHIPENFQDDHPHWPWFEMRGMRNLMVHEYFSVSPEIMWETIQNDLPELAQFCDEALRGT
ncbi:MAG: HepT-like ribonuclease domain-containing protein [Myxococcota bacterium]